MTRRNIKLSTYHYNLGGRDTVTFGGVPVEYRAVLACYGRSNRERLFIYGLEKRKSWPSDYYTTLQNGAVHLGVMYVPLADMPLYIDLVRNEKPVYIRLSTSNASSHRLGTGAEPAGDGE